jgi:hypothetical protein
VVYRSESFHGRANIVKNIREMSVTNLASGIYLVKLVLDGSKTVPDGKYEVKGLMRE